MTQPESDLPPIEEVPAAHLSGRELGNGWRVLTRVTKASGATGGHFSICYIAEHRDGRRAFLKALNFPAARSGPGPLVDQINEFTSAYIFERDLYRQCSANNLTRVITMLDYGEVRVEEAGPFLSEVPYMIFEMADGDIRAFQARSEQIDSAWVFRVMKHTLEGLEQLHSSHTAHQDLKPSNVLTQDHGREMKLGDLGRAERREVRGPWSEHIIPGARPYAPPEQHYGSFGGKWEERKAADLYLAGSLGAQLFTGHCMSILIQHALPNPFRVQNWGGTFVDALPYLQTAHSTVLDSIEGIVTQRTGHADTAIEFVAAIGQMTFPDPTRRGHPRDRAAMTSSYAVRRYVSLMDLLAARAHIRMNKA